MRLVRLCHRRAMATMAGKQPAPTPSLPSQHTPSASSSSSSSKREGNVSDAFASLSSAKQEPLPDRYRQLKCDLVRGREAQITDGWKRLLRELERENEIIAQRGSAVVPQIAFSELERAGGGGAGIRSLGEELRKRGVVVVRGVVPEGEARAYKEEAEEYIRNNPSTKAFPADNPQVFELYWSPPQLKARSHPNYLKVQRELLSWPWHVSRLPTTEPATTAPAAISLTTPLSYADRLRIRRPGDSSFALAPHIDGGGVERWERDGYGRGRVYDDDILAGAWEAHDPWEAGGRAAAATSRHDGLGVCSVFRAWQGWLSLSRTGPAEGTLRVLPLLRSTMAYVLLRPLFGAGADGGDWELVAEEAMTSCLEGARPGFGQEVSAAAHPHLELERTMVSVPEVGPGDYVAWHCDAIHAVDALHRGSTDSSVMYMPVCPTTATNARYVARQREAFLRGAPGPDFPGGEGEARHVGRPTEGTLRRGGAGGEALRSMGLDRLVVGEGGTAEEERAVAEANVILGFDVIR